MYLRRRKCDGTLKPLTRHDGLSFGAHVPNPHDLEPSRFLERRILQHPSTKSSSIQNFEDCLAYNLQ
ncbi:hypothetical protein YC2023_018463 [Brassica napus]